MEKYHPKNSFYETSELKLAALLLAEIPNSHFEITENLNLIKKNIKIIYLNEYSADVERLIREFLERRANVHRRTWRRKFFWFLS